MQAAESGRQEILKDSPRAAGTTDLVDSKKSINFIADRNYEKNIAEGIPPIFQIFGLKNEGRGLRFAPRGLWLRVQIDFFPVKPTNEQKKTLFSCRKRWESQEGNLNFSKLQKLLKNIDY